MPIRHARILRTAALAAAVLLAPLALAQSDGALERAAPPSALLALGFAPDGGVPQGLVDALDALDWEGAGATLARLGELLGEEAFGAAAGGGMDADALRDGLAETCAPAAEALTGVDPLDLLEEGLLTVSIAPFAPVPQALAVARASDANVAGALQDALVGCFGGPTFDQDGVPLYVLGDGGDLPLIVARVDDLFLAGTEPNLVRGAIRRLNGADEPSLADGPLGTVRAELAPGGIDLAFDAAALADVIEGLSGSLPPEANPLVVRTVAALRTLGAGATRAAWDDQGLRFEQVLVVPDDAPDAALARLLTSAPRAGRPLWLPADASAIASNHLPLRGWIDYVDGWLVDLEPLTGTRADVRGLAADSLDLDLDAALLGWVGETVHTVTLEPLGTDLRGWISGPGTVVMVPVADEAAARVGIELLGPGLLRSLASLTQLDAGSPMDPFGADPFAEPSGLDALFGTESVAVEAITIGGVDADRIRMGPTLDLAVAVVDGHLLLASPPAALGALLEARAGGSDLLSGTAGAPWRAAYAAVPDAARDVSISDVPATLTGLAELGELASQPLASAIQTALVVAPWESTTSFDDDFGGSFEAEAYDPFADPFLLDENGRTPPEDWDAEALVGTPLAERGAIELGTTLDAELTDAEPYLVWDLVGAAPGTLVQVEVVDPTRFDVDTYVYVVDADTGLVLFSNDDFGGTDLAAVIFDVVEGVRYRIVASSFGGFATGAIVVSVRDRAAVLAEAEVPEPVEPEEPEEPVEVEPEIDPPTFAELLGVTDLTPRALAILAERSGLAVSATTVEGNVVRTLTTIPLR
ncbi:MAG: hypothetical protein ABR510_05600 [Trueperaceae bacterium]